MTTLIGICGRTASGKTSIAREICWRLNAEGISAGLLQMDNMYRELSDMDHDRALRNEYDFDSLSAFDLPALKQQLAQARSGNPVEFSHYDHSTHKHLLTTEVLPAAKVWVVEGLYLFADDEIANAFDLKVFMDVDSDDSLTRRIRRDCVERGRTVESVLDQYQRFVKPAYERLVQPYRNRSDITIHRGMKNPAALDAVLHYIRGRQLKI
jgi:uridine kinase